MRNERMLGLAIGLVLLIGLVATLTVTSSTRTSPVAGHPLTTAPVILPIASAPTSAPTPLATPSRSLRTTPPASPTSSPRVSATHAAPVGPQTISHSGPRGAYQPLSITVTLTPGAGTTRTPFALRVRATDGDGQVRLGSVGWGDGSSYIEPMVAYTCAVPQPTPPTYQPSSSRLDHALAHAWRLPGTYTLRVLVQSGPPPCRYGSRATEESQSAVFTVRIIREGEVTSNGPAQPSVGPLQLEKYEGLKARFYAPANDTDGWLARYVVDWGDGSKPELHASQATCDDGTGHRYPGVQDQQGSGAYANHDYAKPGRYRVKLTVVSMGCGGKDQQRASRSASIGL